MQKTGLLRRRPTTPRWHPTPVRLPPARYAVLLPFPAATTSPDRLRDRSRPGARRRSTSARSEKTRALPSGRLLRFRTVSDFLGHQEEKANEIAHGPEPEQ